MWFNRIVAPTFEFGGKLSEALSSTLGSCDRAGAVQGSSASKAGLTTINTANANTTNRITDIRFPMGRRTNAEVVSYSRWDAFSRIGVASHNVADRWPGRVLRTCSEIDIGRSRRCSKRVVMRPTHWYA